MPFFVDTLKDSRRSESQHSAYRFFAREPKRSVPDGESPKPESAFRKYGPDSNRQRLNTSNFMSRKLSTPVPDSLSLQVSPNRSKGIKRRLSVRPDF